MGIVLASGSPRRLELLKMIGLEDIRVIADTSDEVIIPGLPPVEQVCRLSLQKACNVGHLCSGEDIIIAADTLVYICGKPLGKPNSESAAAAMLAELSGRMHSVYTGVTLIRGAKHMTAAERTDVYFRDISDREIEMYVKTGEPVDKAGAYAAQGRAAIFIERIEGEFFNVIGLPVCRLVKMLKKYGVEL